MSVGEALRSPQFVVLVLTNFFCCATHSGPIFHTVSYAQTCGIPLVAAVSIYSVEGLAGMGGRIGFGLLGDRFGAKRILVLGLLAQAFGALAYVFARGLGEFYTVAAIFGFIYAGVMPLYAVLARENFPLRMMGTVIGGTAMAGSLGMALGPLAGGLIYDALASYTWLYVGSWAMGIGAFLIAMTFRPLPKDEPTLAPRRQRDASIATDEFAVDPALAVGLVRDIGPGFALRVRARPQDFDDLAVVKRADDLAVKSPHVQRRPGRIGDHAALRCRRRIDRDLAKDGAEPMLRKNRIAPMNPPSVARAVERKPSRRHAD